MPVAEIQIGGNSVRKIRYFLKKITIRYEKQSIPANNTHFFELCEKDARSPRVEFVDFPNNSLNFNETHTSSLNVHETHTFSEKRVSFLRIMRKRRTLPKGRICRFS